MSEKVFRKKILASSIALVIGSSMSMPLVAEESNEQEDDNVVVVTGIRGSLKENISQKRNANAIVDVITSQDIGKFPDKNVAESLSRVTGVAITRDFGEGEKISVRGSDPTKNRTLLNGQNVASADWFVLDEPTRSFNYTLLPSEIVSSLEVFKSPTASIDEGSIGGTVILKTRKPLNQEAHTIYGSAELQHSDLPDETDPQFSGMYSWKNDAENFGILVSYVNQERTVRRDGYEVLGWGNRFDSANDPTVPADLDGIRLPGILGNAYFVQNRERETFTTSVQFAPTRELDFTLNYMNSELEADNTNYNLLHVPKWSVIPGWRGGNGSMISDYTVENGALVAATFADHGTNSTAYNVIDRIASSETETIDLEINYAAENFELRLQFGDTSAEGGTIRDRFYEYGARTEYTFDIRGGDIDVSHPAGGFAPGDAASYGLGWIQGASKPQTDEETYAQIDLEIPVEMGAFEAFKFGVKSRDHEKSQDMILHRWHNLNAGADFDGDGTEENGLAEMQGLYPWYADFVLGSTPSNHQSGLGGYSQGYPLLNTDAMIDFVNGLATNYYDNLDAIYTIQEDIQAFYWQADFEGEDFRGNLGVRVVDTDTNVSSWSYTGNWWDDSNQGCDGISADCTRAWLTDRRSDTEVLPSLNAIFDLADDAQLRVALYRSMARPDYAKMVPTTRANEDTGTAITGTTELDPQFANAFDVGYEWYYADSSMFAVTYFFKDVSSYVIAEAQAYTIIDDQTNQPIIATRNVLANGAGGITQGLEFILQHDFENGYGFSSNYTFTDAQNDGERDLNNSGTGLVRGASKHMMNLAGYYENDTFGARLMYNYRSKYYDGINDFGAEQFSKSYGQLDASVSWHVTEYLDIKFEAVNLTDEIIEKYHQDENRFSKAYKNGRRFVLGASLRF